MLKASYILIFFSVALALALLVQFSSPAQNPSLIGSNACESCHASRSSGSTFREWKFGPHARAFRSLKSPIATEYIQKNAIDPESCLSCHTTLGRSARYPYENQFVTEGVGCERCHGPGSEYSPSEVMRDFRAFRLAGGASGSLAECNSCHRTSTDMETSPTCPVDSSVINPISAWHLVGHSRSTKLPKTESAIESPVEIQDFEVPNE